MIWTSLILQNGNFFKNRNNASFILKISIFWDPPHDCIILPNFVKGDYPNSWFSTFNNITITTQCIFKSWQTRWYSTQQSIASRYLLETIFFLSESRFLTDFFTHIGGTLGKRPKIAILILCVYGFFSEKLKNGLQIRIQLKILV